MILTVNCKHDLFNSVNCNWQIFKIVNCKKYSTVNCNFVHCEVHPLKIVKLENKIFRPWYLLNKYFGLQPICKNKITAFFANEMGQFCRKEFGYFACFVHNLQLLHQQEHSKGLQSLAGSISPMYSMSLWVTWNVMITWHR